MIGPLYAWIITWATRQGSHLEMEGSGLKLSRKKFVAFRQAEHAS